MKKPIHKNLKIFSVILSILIILPLIYALANATLPYLFPTLRSAAIFSAKLSFFNLKNSISDVIANNIDIKLDPLTHINETVLIDDPYYDLGIPIIDDSSSQENNENNDNNNNNESDESQSEPQKEKPENAGTILRKTYGYGNPPVYININNGYIKNCTSIKPEKILSVIKNKPNIKINANNKPEVLIMHTHATESFQMEQRDWFDKSYTARTTNNNSNVTIVGDEIEKQLIEAGIGVIHDKTLHDYPSYNGSYGRSAVTVKKILKENPTIKIVLDIHRDAIQPDKNTIIAPTTVINSKPAAQVMIISGCDDGTMNMPKYMENLKFSAALQRTLEADYPTLARPVLFDYRKYNQDLTTGSILIEMGGHGNTLDEAIYSGELVGKSLVKLLLTLK